MNTSRSELDSKTPEKRLEFGVLETIWLCWSMISESRDRQISNPLVEHWRLIWTGLWKYSWLGVFVVKSSGHWYVSKKFLDESRQHQKFALYKKGLFYWIHVRSCTSQSNLNSLSTSQRVSSRRIPLEIFVCVDQQLWTTIWNFSFFVELRNLELGTWNPRPQTTEPQIRNPEPCSIYFRQRGVVLHFQRFDRSCCCSSLRSFINKSQKCRAYFIIQVL